MKTFKFLFTILLGVLLFCSCEKTPKDEPDLKVELSLKEYKYLDASAFDKWVYFSFEKGDIVEVSDYENDLSWDLAFCRSAVRTNGGTSGKGKAAVYDTKKKDWNVAIEAASKGEYVVDTKQNLRGYPTMTESTEQSYNAALKWVTVDMSGHGAARQQQGPKYIILKTVFVLKTANGNFAKLQVTDRYGAKGEMGLLTFNYQYNSDGSDKFTK